MKSQIDLFADLVKNTDPAYIENIWDEMDIFEWTDIETPKLYSQDVKNILLRYRARELSVAQVEAWAGYMEAADMAILDGICDEAVIKAVYLLANTAIEFPLTDELAKKIIDDL